MDHLTFDLPKRLKAHIYVSIKTEHTDATVFIETTEWEHPKLKM